MTSFTNFLFVPANRPDRFDKALASGTDLICIDLEDSVPAELKDEGRDNVITALGEFDLSRTAVRTNGLGTTEGLADLLALKACEDTAALIFLPMVRSPAEIEIVRNVLGEKARGLIPLVESVEGLENARAIASAPGVSAVMFGGVDFSGELGVKLEWEPLLTARSQLVMACAAAKVRCVDAPYINLDDKDGLAEESARARALGFHAKAAIHPGQVEAIRAAFAPSEAELTEAREAIAAFEQAGGAAIRYEGRMLEAPVVLRYRQMLKVAGDV